MTVDVEAYCDAYFEFLHAEGCPCEGLNPHQMEYITAWAQDAQNWPDDEITPEIFNRRAFSELEVVKCLDAAAIELRIDRLHRMQAERKRQKQEQRELDRGTKRSIAQLKRAEKALERARWEYMSPIERLFSRHPGH